MAELRSGVWRSKRLDDLQPIPQPHQADNLIFSVQNKTWRRTRGGRGRGTAVGVAERPSIALPKLEAVEDMKYDEEPNYAKLISLFDSLIDPCGPFKPIRIDGAIRVGQKRARLLINLGKDKQPKKKVRIGIPATHWISVYNCRRPMKQRYHYNISDNRLHSHVDKGKEDGLYISCVASATNLWALIMDAGTGFSSQIYQLSATFLNKTWIMDQWEKNFYITSIAGADNGSSLVVMSKGTLYTQQSYKVSRSFPFKWIHKKWKEGFHVTSMTTAGSKWGVIMSLNAGYSDQVVELEFLYPNEGIHRRWGSGYNITSMAATADKAAFILSIPKQKMMDKTQETLRTSSFPSTHLKEKWCKNMFIASVCYRRTAVDMDESNSPPDSTKENPDRKSEANIGSTDDVETIARRFQDSFSIAKQHAFGETQPVGQLKEIGGLSLPEGPVTPPAPSSGVS